MMANVSSIFALILSCARVSTSARILAFNLATFVASSVPSVGLILVAASVSAYTPVFWDVIGLTAAC
jgi:hypothetical protein